METERIIILQQQEQIAALENQRNSLQAKLKELSDDFQHVKSSCLATVLDAGECYRKSCRLDSGPFARSFLALQYRDYLFIYSRMYKNNVPINDEVMKDIEFISKKATEGD